MSKYFKEIEDNMDLDFLQQLDEAREYADIPFKITSAYRTPEHNEKIGGVPNSSHLKGLAVDISISNSNMRFVVLKALIMAGFTRIGVAKTFIHVDADLDKSQEVAWTY